MHFLQPTCQRFYASSLYRVAFQLPTVAFIAAFAGGLQLVEFYFQVPCKYSSFF